MSKLVKRVYVRNEPDECYPWEVDSTGEPLWSDDLHTEIHYALYEIGVDLLIDPDKGTVDILRFVDGTEVFENKKTFERVMDGQHAT